MKQNEDNDDAFKGGEVWDLPFPLKKMAATMIYHLLLNTLIFLKKLFYKKPRLREVQN